MKLVFAILYFIGVLTSKTTYIDLPLHSKGLTLKCSDISTQYFCSYNNIDDIYIELDTSKVSSTFHHVKDLVPQLTYSQDHVNIQIVDEIAPVIILNDKRKFIKKGFDPYDVVERIEDDSDFSYETYLNDSTVTIIATDAYGNISSKSVNIEFVEESEYEVLQYIDSDVLKTLQNYLDAQKIDRNNIGIGIKDIRTNTYYYQNEHQQFTAASSMKLPLSVQIYDGISKGYFRYNSSLQYKEKHYANGTTVVPLYYSFGDYIPISNLLRFTLVPSDNIAANILFDLLASRGNLNAQFNSFFHMENSEEVNVIDGNKITPYFMIHVLEELLEENQTKPKYEELVKHITSAYNGRYLKKNLPGVTIAHKCGFYNGNINDTGIVYIDNTPRYLISIYTQGYGIKDNKGTTKAEYIIAKLNQLTYEYYSLVDQGIKN